jgi:signal transduction histidine kinase
VASDSFFVPLLDFTRTTTFRWTLIVGGLFAGSIVLLFAVVYWRTEDYLTARSDAVITQQARAFSSATPEKRRDVLEWFFAQDPRGVQHAGLFDPQGHRIAGNVARIPPDLHIDGPAQRSLVSIAPDGVEERVVRGIGRRLPDGNLLVIGRKVDEGVEIAEIVAETLIFGLFPALCLSLAAGVLLSRRAQKRVEEVNARVQRIVAGNLHERLPTRGVGDPFDKLATIVNGMLEKIEALVHEVAGVGDDIAHELRTPLTRVRIALERGRTNSRTVEEARAVFERSISGLDQSLTIITALLRIAEIEHSQRLAGFSEVKLAELVREVCDLYEPIAEEKGVRLQVQAEEEPVVRGDRDLLLEAVANLVDNAIKFTPEGGRVQLALIDRDGECVVRISDTGPGITEEERETVLRRFYRSDRSRQTPGVGLGLSLVSAIIKLHGFRLTITAGPHCAVEIICPRA